LIAGTRDQQAAVFLVKANLRGDAALEFAARPLDGNFVTVDIHLHRGGYNYGHFPYS
jgi:hypothetical protein